MGNNKEDNGLGTQVIEDTEPPIIFDVVVTETSSETAEPAVVVAPETPTETETPVVAAEPAQSAAIVVEPQQTAAVATEPAGTVIVPEVETPSGDTVILQQTPPTPEPVITPEPAADNVVVQPLETVIQTPPVVQPVIIGEDGAGTGADPYVVGDALGAALDAVLGNMEEQEKKEAQVLDAALEAMLGNLDAQDAQESKVTEDTAEALDAALAAMLTNLDEPEQKEPEKDPLAESMMQQAREIMEQAKRAQEQAEQAARVAQEAKASQPQPQPQPQVVVQAPQSDAAAEAAKAMMQQAQLMMQQAQAAQAQAAQVRQESMRSSQPDAATEAAKAMMQQAQLMMQQAQAAQAQAQAAATTRSEMSDASAREVDRLKSELDGMRDMVSRLTATIAQNQNAGNAATPPPMYYGMPDADGYRRLENELDRLRRELAEKELREREKEIERRAKEAAEKDAVKEVRPEMVQMSDSRDLTVAPMPPQGASGGPGGEYIPLADGVFYSTKDKQVYVMTPASKAAGASPTLEPAKRRAAPAKKPVAKKPAKKTAAKRASAHKKGGARRPSRRGAAPSRRPTHR